MLLTALIKIRLSSNRLKRFSLVLMVLVVTACGQMGPLYLPVDETAASDIHLSSTTEFRANHVSFVYQQGQLMAEQVTLASIAEQFSTPCYVDSRQAIEQSYLGYRQALIAEELIST